MGSRNYRDLILWQKSMELTVMVYGASRAFPKEETFGLRSQLRRAAVSIPANVAEGQGRGTRAEFRRFLQISYGSLREVETHVLLAQRLEFLAAAVCEEILALTEEVGRLINGLLNSLDKR